MALVFPFFPPKFLCISNDFSFPTLLSYNGSKCLFIVILNNTEAPDHQVMEIEVERRRELSVSHSSQLYLHPQHDQRY